MGGFGEVDAVDAAGAAGDDGVCAGAVEGCAVGTSDQAGGRIEGSGEGAEPLGAGSGMAPPPGVDGAGSGVAEADGNCDAGKPEGVCGYCAVGGTCAGACARRRSAYCRSTVAVSRYPLASRVAAVCSRTAGFRTVFKRLTTWVRTAAGIDGSGSFGPPRPSARSCVALARSTDAVIG